MTIPTTPPTEAFELIERIRQGDGGAFTLLFEKYKRRLTILIYYKLDPKRRLPEDVEEILQETFLGAFEDLAQFQYRSPGSFLNWLSRIAEHVIADGARFQNRQKRSGGHATRFRSESNPNGPEPEVSITPSRILIQKQEVEILLGKLNDLPPHYREVLLAKIEGLSTKEMAERFGKPRESVALLLHRAVRRFRELQSPQ